MARPSQHSVHPRELVLRTLRRRKAPQTAYQLLEALEPHGIKGPPIVYRALEALQEAGLVHKVQRTGQFVACNCDDDHQHSLSILTVCEDCETVDELHDHAVMHHLEKLRGMDVSLAAHAVIELPITCQECRG